MKKILTLLLTMSIMLSVTACGGNGKKEKLDVTKVGTKVETLENKNKESEKTKSTEEQQTEEQPTEASTKLSETIETSEQANVKHEHSYKSEITTASTCLAEGIKTFTCSCGDSYTEKIAATGSHAWGEWTTIKEATTTAKGTSQRKCKNCSTAEQKDIEQLCNYFYNASLDGRWCSNSISVVAKEVYFENGKLVAHCYIVNGYSTNASKVDITEISICGKDGKEIAHAYFPNQNMFIDALSYVEHTFTFGADTIISTNVDMSVLSVDANFSAYH